MYLDSAYIAKFYVNERDSRERPTRNRQRPLLCVFDLGDCRGNLRISSPRPRRLDHPGASKYTAPPFSQPYRGSGPGESYPSLRGCCGVYSLSVAGLPAEVYLRAGDAVHLTTAADEGESEIWTNDRHLLAAAPHFGLRGRTV